MSFCLLSLLGSYLYVELLACNCYVLFIIMRVLGGIIILNFICFCWNFTF